MQERLPLFRHRLASPSAFRPEALVEAVRVERGIDTAPVPQICVLDFDGDLTDWLVRSCVARPHPAWACFHTTMYSFDVDGMECGIVARTIGGPYAVLVAEQLHVSGARVVLGLTSAGRVHPSLPVPGLVVATSALRDEGTSYHYLAAGEAVAAPAKLADSLYMGLQGLGLPVSQGLVWTTDAPYRETLEELREHAANGALAVEMQAASLFAFAQARHAEVGVVAHVTNAIDHAGEPFDKGADEHGWHLTQAMCRAANEFLQT
ncbi:MAG: nucleoside phosphorylase [Acidobacteriaceae bacterium]